VPWRKFWKTAPNGTQARPIFLQNPGPAGLPIHTTRDRGLVLNTQPGTPGWLCCWRRTRTAGAVPEPARYSRGAPAALGTSDDRTGPAQCCGSATGDGAGTTLHHPGSTQPTVVRGAGAPDDIQSVRSHWQLRWQWQLHPWIERRWRRWRRNKWPCWWLCSGRGRVREPALSQR
jgi:hypothetical protein